jgi:sulfatase modifying factor 1
MRKRVPPYAGRAYACNVGVLRVGLLATLLGGVLAVMMGCGLSGSGTAPGLDAGSGLPDVTTDTASPEGAAAEGSRPDGQTDGPTSDAPRDAPVDALDASDGSRPPDAGPDGPVVNDGGCPVGQGPSMVLVPGYQGGPSFCIDSTEVTDSQYVAFLSASDAGAQPSYCAFNSGFIPSGGAPPSDDFPVVFVNWCDAYAYCAWAGKRLCGGIGGGSVRYQASDGSDPTKDQWYAACSQDGMLQYPYGMTSQPGYCDVPPSGGRVQVGAFTLCVGGYPGMFDMVGNVQEWEDSCSDTMGSMDSCVLRGGSFLNPNNANCPHYQLVIQRDFENDDIGFRCCWP